MCVLEPSLPWASYPSSVHDWSAEAEVVRERTRASIDALVAKLGPGVTGEVLEGDPARELLFEAGQLGLLGLRVALLRPGAAPAARQHLQPPGARGAGPRARAPARRRRGRGGRGRGVARGADVVSRVVIAGGGIAGLEALIALREHLGPEHRIDLLEPGLELVERQRSVGEPFGAAPPRHFDLGRIAADHGAHLAPDQLKDVDAAARVVHTVRGDAIEYDALLVAVGARPDVAIPGALTFTGPRDVGAYRKFLGALATGRVRTVAFAVPSGVCWSLPLYELALLTADRLRASHRDGVSLVVVTPERAPLDVFGAAIAARIRALLSQRGIAVRTQTTPVRVGAGGLTVDGGELVRADWIVALPRLNGPWIAGLPHDGDGFIETDEHCAVVGVERVWAAGDGTAFPIKQGGLAAQQADAAATAIAAALGAPVDPEPFRPVLHALLLDPPGERLLDADAASAAGEEPWWPASKVAARRLAPYLAAAAGEPVPEPEPTAGVDVTSLLLALADRHAAADPALALRCLDAAAQVGGELPGPASRQREELAAGLRG